jgi:hypothetical protein
MKKNVENQGYTMASMTFSEYRQKSKMMQLVEGDCSRTKTKELPCMNKVHCLVNNMEKPVSILGYVDDILFQRRYERIAYPVRLLVQIFTVKALLHLWDQGYRCFRFKDINMTPTIKEYA